MAEGSEGVVERLVAESARTVYAVPLAEFVATRKAVAADVKASVAAELGAKEGTAAAKTVLALRKPTLTAWAMNLVPRGDDTTALADLVGLGARMRAAQSRLDTATLTSVRGERDAALTAYVDLVVAAAEKQGGSLSPAARDEVRASAIAALADESASDALASGQLTRALSYSGFGEVDLTGAVGVTSSGSIVSVLPGGGEGAAGAQAVATAGGAEDDGGEEDDELSEEELAAAVAAAKAEKARAKAQRRAEAEVQEAEAEMAQAQSALDAAEDAARAARRAVIAAQKRLDAARVQVASSLGP